MDVDAAEYCRAVEAHLCRRNDGHIIRIVGPSFERVCAWNRKGIPLRVAFSGIDRYAERYYAKGPRRRPVQVDFCEADVLDVFDEWRRALGISSAVLAGPADADAAESGAERESGRHESLAAHVERVIARLTALRAGEHRVMDAVIDDTIRELDGARAGARKLRGEARAGFLARLADLDARLLAVAREQIGSTVLSEIGGEAEAELAPFRARMPAAAYEHALAACVDRLVREKVKLPTLALE